MQLAEAEMIEVTFVRDFSTEAGALDWMRKLRLRRWERVAGSILSRWAPPILFGFAVNVLFTLMLGPAASASGFLGIIAFLIWFDGVPRLTRQMVRRLTDIQETAASTLCTFGPDSYVARQEHVETHIDWRAVSAIALRAQGVFIAFGGQYTAIPASAWANPEDRVADAARIEDWWREATGVKG